MMLLLVGLLIAWVIASLFAVALCVAAYRGDRGATPVRAGRVQRGTRFRTVRAS